MIVVLAFVFAALSESSNTSTPVTTSQPSTALGAITVSAPPPNPAADAPCTALIDALPRTLSTTDGTLVARPAFSTWTYVAAWGQPAVVSVCGVPRPAGFVPNTDVFAINGVNFFQTQTATDNVFTAVDRAVYVQVSVPRSYRQPPIGALATAIASALPSVCGFPPAQTDPARLCVTRR